MDDGELQILYAWIDEIPLSRPKRNITRDFSDGVMVAEVIHHFIPKLISMHNYSPASSQKQKMANWNHLQAKVFKKIGLSVPENVVSGVVNNKAGVVEVVLNNLRIKIDQYKQRKAVGLDGAGETGWEGGASGKKKKATSKSGTPEPSPSRTNVKPLRAQDRGMPDFGTHNPLEGAVYDDLSHTDKAKALHEKDHSIMDYQETVDILNVKVRKLEQLVKLKDRRIAELATKLRQAGLEA